MFGLGTPEIILIAIVLILLFGSQKIIGFARDLGQTKKELTKVKKEIDKG